MSYMNSSEIDMYVEQHARHLILSQATRFMQKLRDEVNSKSDGWPYVAKVHVATEDLVALIKNGRPDKVTEADYLKALKPIERYIKAYAKTAVEYGNPPFVMPPAKDQVTPMTRKEAEDALFARLKAESAHDFARLFTALMPNKLRVLGDGFVRID